MVAYDASSWLETSGGRPAGPRSKQILIFVDDQCCQYWRFGAILALSDLGVAPEEDEVAPGALRHLWRLWENGLKSLILLRNREIFEKEFQFFVLKSQNMT